MNEEFKLQKIAMYKIEGVVEKDGSKAFIMEKSHSTVKLDEVLYFFTPSALGEEPIVIQAPWRDPHMTHSAKVYARTMKGLYATEFRSLKELQTLLPHNFIEIHRSLLLNFSETGNVEMRNRLKQISVIVGAKFEWLTISRSNHELVRKLLGMRRTRRAKAKAKP